MREQVAISRLYMMACHFATFFSPFFVIFMFGAHGNLTTVEVHLGNWFGWSGNGFTSCVFVDLLAVSHGVFGHRERGEHVQTLGIQSAQLYLFIFTIVRCGSHISKA